MHTGRTLSYIYIKVFSSLLSTQTSDFLLSLALTLILYQSEGLRLIPCVKFLHLQQQCVKTQQAYMLYQKTAAIC